MWWAMAAKAAQNAIGTLGTYYNQRTQNAALKHQASMNRINARLERLNAEQSLRKGEKQEQQIQNAAAKLKGKQKVGYGSSGVRLDSDSAQQVLNETDYMAQVDELQTHANALADAWGHMLNATNYENNANIAMSQRQSAFGSALSYSVGKFLQDIGSFGDLFGGGDDKPDNGHPGTVPAPTAPAMDAASHWTTIQYAKDSWDSSYNNWRNGGFTIGNRTPYNGGSGFNWWR